MKNLKAGESALTPKPHTNQKKLETLGALISGITHEINTPLHYLQNNLTFLQVSFKDLFRLNSCHHQFLTRARNGDSLTKSEWDRLEALEKEIEPGYLQTEILQALQQSLEGIDLVSRLVLALKDYSFPSLHEFSLTDINTCITTVCTITRHEWKRVAEMQLDLAGDLPFLFGSRDELHQVLLNLIVNAAHAIAEKIATGAYLRGEIVVATKAIPEGIEVLVHDDGPGILPEHLGKIFDPSFTTKKAGQGTGLGLALVKRIVEEAHGGRIRVVSDRISGTTFSIVLPHRRDDKEP